MVAIILAYPKHSNEWSILSGINATKFPSLRTPTSNIDNVECFVFDDDQQAVSACTALTSWSTAHCMHDTLGCAKINLFTMDPRFSIADYVKNVPEGIALSKWDAKNSGHVDSDEVADAMRAMPTRVAGSSKGLPMESNGDAKVDIPAVPEGEAVAQPQPKAVPEKRSAAPKPVFKVDATKTYGSFSADTFALIVNNTSQFGNEMKRTAEFRSAVAAYISNEAAELVQTLTGFDEASGAAVDSFSETVSKRQLDLQNAIKYASLVTKALAPAKTAKRKRGAESDAE
jgi:hypothetical protein